MYKVTKLIASKKKVLELLLITINSLRHFLQNLQLSG